MAKSSGCSADAAVNGPRPPGLADGGWGGADTTGPESAVHLPGRGLPADNRDLAGDEYALLVARALPRYGSCRGDLLALAARATVQSSQYRPVSAVRGL